MKIIIFSKDGTVMNIYHEVHEPIKIDKWHKVIKHQNGKFDGCKEKDRDFILVPDAVNVYVGENVYENQHVMHDLSHEYEKDERNI